MYKRGLQVYMSTRRLAFVELGMADMRAGWVSPLDCRFFFWLDTTLALSEISMGISKPHSASVFGFFC